jgi:tetratricopeptide (TPR) repeat protein
MKAILRLAAVAAVVLAASPATGQRVHDTPARPSLPAAADTNDARVYYAHGVERLTRQSPGEAAAAFYWAHQLDPAWSAPLYGRYAALLMSHPRRLVDYWEGSRRVVRSGEVMGIDSLYFRALTLDPFLYRRFEKDIVRLYMVTMIMERNRLRESDRNEIDFHVNNYLRSGSGPYMRGVIAYGEGRFPEALRFWDESLRRARRKGWIRTERGRLFGHVGNDAAALVEFGHALTEWRGREEREMVYVYESKALLEHSIGALHERMGNAGEAREAYGRALQEDLSFYPAHVRLGALALADGDTASALGSLALAVEMPMVDPHTRSEYAALLVETGDLDGGVEQAEAAIQQSPHFFVPYLVLADAAERRGERVQAAARLREFLERAPRSVPQRAPAERRLAALEGQLDAPAAASGAGQ